LPYAVVKDQEFYDMHPEQLFKQMLHPRGVISHPDIIHSRAAQPMSDVQQREFAWVLKRVGLDTPPAMS
jgi:hypothetical protein